MKHSMQPEEDLRMEDEEEDELTEDELNSPVSAEINGLFDNNTSVGKMADKVNSALSQMSDRIRSFPQENNEDKRQE